MVVRGTCRGCVFVAAGERVNITMSAPAWLREMTLFLAANIPATGIAVDVLRNGVVCGPSLHHQLYMPVLILAAAGACRLFILHSCFISRGCYDKAFPELARTLHPTS